MAVKNEQLKMAIISGASHALKYKEENPRATESEIINFISFEAKNIIKKINQEF